MLAMPAPQPLTTEQLQALAERHGVALQRPAPRVRSGQASTVYELNDEVVLRVPHPTTGERTFEAEARILALARAAGVRTPAVLAQERLPWAPGTPYMLMERVRGVNLGEQSLPPHATPGAYRALGRNLARWHLRPTAGDDALPALPRDPHEDLRPGVAALAEQGVLPSEAARWLVGWLDHLAPVASVPHAWRLVHGDARPTNVMVEERAWAFRALLDWGDAHWADPASEFALLPLRAVPLALEGYREVRPDAQAEVNEQRVLWYQLGWGLHALRRAPTHDGTWSAPPTGRLLELLRFYVEGPDEVWRTSVPRA